MCEEDDGARARGIALCEEISVTTNVAEHRWSALVYKFAAQDAVHVCVAGAIAEAAMRSLAVKARANLQH